MFGLAILFGMLVGLALGLTGGGGGILAAPLLAYGLAIAPREAVGISLASVGGIAIFGAVPKVWRGEADLRTAVLFTLFGMIGAPVGQVISGWLPENLLLLLFAFFMIVIALRMWRSSSKKGAAKRGEFDSKTAMQGTGKLATGKLATSQQSGLLCQRDADDQLIMTSRCGLLLGGLGLITGILSGMFGVGGGFIIVPALITFSGLRIHRAIATSLVIIVLVSASGVASYVLAGNAISLATTSQFFLGGVAGMLLGSTIAKRLDGQKLQKVFAGGIVATAIFVMAKSISS